VSPGQEMKRHQEDQGRLRIISMQLGSRINKEVN
jgi:hypothetical protein